MTEPAQPKGILYNVIKVLLCCLVTAILMYPFLARRPRGMYRDPCATNMKQIGTATAIYLGDNNDRMPLENWIDGLFAYTKNSDITDCPEIKKAGKHYGYAMKIGMIGLNALTIEEPGATAMYFETDALGKNVVANLAARGFRHNKAGSAVTFADTHA
ncbi:MAG: hypothetical protein ABL962_22370, partial [Fimbriimonadaceae bacterium]